MPTSRQFMPHRLTISKRRLLFQYRRATWWGRSFPNFIIVGAQRSGTSSLYAYLSQHPQLLPSYRKEVHFFDGGINPDFNYFEKGQAWYRAHFPFGTNRSTHSRTFEASPLYLFNPLAPRRIFDLIPKVKLIVVLRNPVERAISHYFHTKQRGFEPLPIYEALREEEKRLEPILASEDYKNDGFIRYSYKSRGLYKNQLEKYLNYFSWQQFLVLNSEELFSDPNHALRQVFEFVEVDTGFKINDLTPRNVANNKSVVDPDIYSYLNTYFSSHNQALYELVGKSYGW